MLNGAFEKGFDWTDWTDWVVGIGVVAIISAMLVMLGAYVLALATLRAWVMTQLWRLYLVPLFGFQELSFAGALGICLIASFLITRPDFSETHKDITNKQRLVRVFIIFLVPLFALFLGHAYLWIWPL